MKRIAALAVLIFPVLAFAHEGHEHANSFAQGFAHPFTGADHIAAMVLVGFWAALIGGSARFVLPTAFVLAMIAGGAAALAWPAIAGVEAMIAVSLVALGGAVLAAWRAQLGAAAALVAVSALAHGHAHVAEALGTHGSLVSYGMGFVLATVLLHVAGLVVCTLLIRRPSWQFVPRAAGAAAMLLGLSAAITLAPL